MSFHAGRPKAMANLDPEGTTGWEDVGMRWQRRAHDHFLEVWREPRSGPWRWSLDHCLAPKSYSSRVKAMRAARLGAQLGRVPSR